MSWQQFVEAVAHTDIEFPQLKPACLAQAILEGGRETTELSQKYNNHHGMKWRPEMQGCAISVYYETITEPSGGANFCQFPDKASAVRGYWRFLERSPYKGWRNHTNSPSDFLAFIGPIWCPPGYTDGWKRNHNGLVYHEYIMQKLFEEANKSLAAVSPLPTPDQYHELREGDRGQEVAALQRVLNKYNGANLEVDSIFGPQTKQAVMDVERRLGFPADGVADADVLKALPDLLPPIKRGSKTLWIPFARRHPEIPTKWTYKDNYPRGAVVHFTAGKDNPEGTVIYLGRVGYPCLVMGQDGVIYQAFPLNRGGCHSGTKHHDYSVGIEIVSAGRCKPVTINGKRKFAAWFHCDESGNVIYPDQCFPESEMRYVERKGSCREGWYQKYTPAQEDSLIKLLLWLKSQAPDVFSFDDVKGHDECCDEGGRPGAKNDPGGALSMTMPEFRELLKQKYAEAQQRSMQELELVR
jgi:N-acetyl-anhydromuramyl-L-alanine amidase AmpD